MILLAFGSPHNEAKEYKILQTAQFTVSNHI